MTKKLWFMPSCFGDHALRVHSSFQKTHTFHLQMVWPFGSTVWPQVQDAVDPPPQSVHMALLAPLGPNICHCHLPAHCQVTPTHSYTFTEVDDSMETLAVCEQLWLMQFLSCFRLFASGFSPTARCALGVKHYTTETHCKLHCMTVSGQIFLLLSWSFQICIIFRLILIYLVLSFNK